MAQTMNGENGLLSIDNASLASSNEASHGGNADLLVSNPSANITKSRNHGIIVKELKELNKGI
jgi:hypothetical protein